MSGLHEHVPAGTITAAAGAFSGNAPYSQGFIVGVRAKPTTSTTIYDLAVTDREGYVIYSKVGCKGNFSEDTIKIPFIGIVTIAIANATANEAFGLKLLVEP